MINPEALKIVDKKWFNSPVEYETNDLVIRYYVKDKGDEEDKLKNDLLSNVLTMDNFPFNRLGFPKELRNEYNTCEFFDKSLCFGGNKLANPIVKHHYFGTIEAHRPNVYYPAIKIWNFKCGKMVSIPLSDVILNYILKTTYLKYDFYKFKKIISKVKTSSRKECITDYMYTYDKRELVFYTHWMTKVFINLDSDKNVFSNLFDPNFFKDIESVIYNYLCYI